MKAQTVLAWVWGNKSSCRETGDTTQKTSFNHFDKKLYVLRRPGGFCKVVRPDPIPNSAVKRLRANGTMSQDLGE